MNTNLTPVQLRQEAAKHEKIAGHYRELADLLESTHGVTSERRAPESRRTREIYQFLETFGPATAEEIKEKADIPLATVYAVVQKNPSIFKRVPLDGRWTIQSRTS